MSENLTEAAKTEAPDTEAVNSKSPLADNEADGERTPKRPEDLPEKFWDSEKGAVRAEAMTKSYLELERKLGAQNDPSTEEDPGPNELEAPLEITELTPELDACLQGAGLNDEQIKTVHDFGAKSLIPAVYDMVSKIEAHSQIDRLADHFGGENKWREVARQLGNWGKGKFSPKAFQSLTSSYEGVLNLHRMMAAEESEPQLGGGGRSADGALSEAGIKELMRDPRYWRDQDSVIVNKVKEGFRRLYPNEG